MADYTQEALGKVVRDLRTERGLTQAQLGKRAGYGGGAGVSISRIEGGLMEPSDERLTELARELGVARDELVSLAAARTKATRNAPHGGAGRTEDRISRIEEAKATRQQLVREVEALDRANTRAQEAFLLRFQEIAELLRDAPSPDPKDFAIDEPTPPNEAAAEASAQLKFTRFGVEKALSEISGGTLNASSTGDVATEVFTRLAATAVFSLGSLLPAITAAAVLTPLQRASGMRFGAGVAGGIVALAGRTAWFQTTTTRSRKQQQDLSRAEEQVAQTQPGIDALRDLVPRATQILDYIAVHASHALERWATKVGPEPRDWDSLAHSEQDRYFDFAEIAAAQLAVATIKLGDLLAPVTDEWERDKLSTDALLTNAHEVVTSHV